MRQTLIAALFFSTTLFAQQTPTPPAVVAEKIVEIIQSGTWKFRHTVGPDAEGYIQRRLSMTDEEWIARGAAAE